MNELTNQLSEMNVNDTRFKSLAKTQSCRNGNECKMYALRKCTFAHSLAELNPQLCRMDYNCPNYHCRFYHPALESKADFLKRTKQTPLPETVDVPIVRKNVRTKACLRGELCELKGCTFAHSLDDLSPQLCVENEACQKRTTCRYFHPESESKSEFLDRTGQTTLPDVRTEKIVNFRTKACSRGLMCDLPKCTYAHTLEEINPRGCRNSECEITECPFFHMTESKREWARRTGLDLADTDSDSRKEYKRTYQAFSRMIERKDLAGDSPDKPLTVVVSIDSSDKDCETIRELCVLLGKYVNLRSGNVTSVTLPSHQEDLGQKLTDLGMNVTYD